jgi:hypothetical protein
MGDTFVSVLENLRNGQRSVQAPLNGVEPASADARPFQSRVMALPVRVADLGLTAEQTVISYTVTSYHTALGTAPEDIVDQTPPRVFDLAHPALDVTELVGAAPLAVQGETVLTLHFDAIDYARQNPGGILLLYHHNRIETQVEVVTVRYAWPQVLHLPLVGK